MKMIICVSGAVVAAPLTWQQSAFLLPPPSLTRLGETARSKAFLLRASRRAKGHIPPHSAESRSVRTASLNYLLFSLFLALQRVKHRDAQKILKKEWWLSDAEGGMQSSPNSQCVRAGPLGALWMAHAEWVPRRGDQAHWEQVTRGRECFCSAFGPLTQCPMSAVAALKPNIFICEALKREGGAAVRMESSSHWQLHLLWKRSDDRSTMKPRRPALGEGLSYVDMLRIRRAAPTTPPPPPAPLLPAPKLSVYLLGVWGNTWELVIALHGCLHVSSCCFYRIL